MQLSLVAARTLTVRDEHPPAVADAPDPRILHGDGVRHVGAEGKPPRGRVKCLGRARLDEVDAPAVIEAIDVADVEAPATTVAKDRAALDRLTAKVLASRGPDRYEALAVAARDPQLAAASRAGPPQPIDQVNGVAVAKRSGGAGPVTRSRPRGLFDDGRRRWGKRHVHVTANFS